MPRLLGSELATRFRSDRILEPHIFLLNLDSRVGGTSRLINADNPHCLMVRGSCDLINYQITPNSRLQSGVGGCLQIVLV